MYDVNYIFNKLFDFLNNISHKSMDYATTKILE